MPRDNGKTIRRLEAIRLLNDLLTQITNVVPTLPHPVSAISSTTAKILEIALTVLRNKDGIMELAKSCHEVTTMVIDRTITFQDTNLLDDIAELQEILNDIESTIQKYKKRRTFMSILAANSDKEDIIRCQKRMQHMLTVFTAARAVETQQSVAVLQEGSMEIQQGVVMLQESAVVVQQAVAVTRKKVNSVVVAVQQGGAMLQESAVVVQQAVVDTSKKVDSVAVEVQRGVAMLQESSFVAQQSSTRIEKTVNKIVSTLDSTIPRNNDKPANSESNQISQQGRKLLISYQTPTGVGPEIAFAGISAFFLKSIIES